LNIDEQMAEVAIKSFIRKILDRLDHAAAVAKAAHACADASNVDKAVEIALGIEQPMYDANTLSERGGLDQLCRQALSLRKTNYPEPTAVILAACSRICVQDRHYRLPGVRTVALTDPQSRLKGGE
jgi:hypothetical protein